MIPTQAQPTLKLSICITTFNRGSFIGATLDSILPQLTDECEVVILDGGSTDDTQQVMSKYSHAHRQLRYIRQESNNGFDEDCDRVVELARGEYCWLMTDDDLLRPGAIGAVLSELRADLSLIIVNTENMDFTMSRVLQPRWIDIQSDRVYGPNDMDRLVLETGDILQYLGCQVIRRAIWLQRERKRYYGSMFINIGVIFQAPLPGDALVIAKPYVSYRRCNTHAWLPKVIEIVWFEWPALVRTLGISEAAKRKMGSAEPWRSFQELLLWRGMGFYSLAEYRRLLGPRLRSVRERLIPTLVALIPGALAYAMVMIHYSTIGSSYRGMASNVMLAELRESRFHFQNWRFRKRHS